MIKIGITGQPGFIGTHLFKYLGLKDDVERVPFEDDYFNNEEVLNEFVKQCDVIVHLAAMNRHEDPQVIYSTNIELVQKVIYSCEKTNSKPHIIFSSSTQETLDNLYGQSKKDGRLLFEKWAIENNAKFTGMIIPNVFGPFSKPQYNTVVATFCHLIITGGTPVIKADNKIKLIYVNELVEEFYFSATGKLNFTSNSIKQHSVKHTAEITVKEILATIIRFKESYLDKGIIPELNNRFELSLFNTFRCFIPEEKFPFYLTQHTDKRGAFVEIIRTNTSGQFSYSTTKPGITRGNHYHTRKIERFCVVKGEASIELRKVGTNKIITYKVSGSKPAFVDMPIWYTHNITNIGSEELLTLFWINEPYNEEDPDTFFENVKLEDKL